MSKSAEFFGATPQRAREPNAAVNLLHHHFNSILYIQPLR